MLPKPLGHYSQIVRAGDFYFLSGQISVDPDANEVCLFDGDVARQTGKILKNIEAILASENLKKENIVKVTIFLIDLSRFAAVNETCECFFGPHKPARSTVGVAALPKGTAVEIEAIATRM